MTKSSSSSGSSSCPTDKTHRNAQLQTCLLLGSLQSWAEPHVLRGSPQILNKLFLSPACWDSPWLQVWTLAGYNPDCLAPGLLLGLNKNAQDSEFCVEPVGLPRVLGLKC